MRDATFLEVRLAEARPYSVVVKDMFMEGFVSDQDSLGEPSSFKDVVEEGALNLVEALPDVSAAASNGFSLKPGLFKDDVGNVPGIFSPYRGGSASEEVLSLPALDPWLEVS